ncbi:MAG: hypothetical protein UZ21_OP11001000862 [Microgenomates bacterium OLB22]|nr:MAG: hypothetical protein UZ21_OP11001000862 [Microgenomates bacterium OLB22]
METLINAMQTAGIICVGLGVVLCFIRVVRLGDDPLEAIRHTVVIIGFGIILILISYLSELWYNRERIHEAPSTQDEELGLLPTVSLGTSWRL